MDDLHAAMISIGVSMAGLFGVITYGAPVIFLLGSILILLFRAHAKEVAFLLQSIAVALGLALPVCFVVRLVDAGPLSQDDLLKLVKPSACALVDSKAENLQPLERLARDYGLTTD